jgi:uncharacterized protein (DUF58 family)
MATTWPDREAIRKLHAGMQAAARRVRLPLRNRVWRGEAGNWAGAGVGSSIDFQDHRPYLPGDDPRHIDWNAYARSGHYSMKLYREEVRPQIDVALDVSASMLHGKAERSLELFYFAVESALQSGASLRCHTHGDEGTKPWTLDSVLAHEVPAPGSGAGAPAVGRTPWRPGALRVWVSDLLFPGSPEPILAALVAGKGRGVILAPYCREEDAPDWSGNIDLRDCETGASRVQHVSRDLLARYAESYARHFSLWTTAARRHGIAVVRVAAEPDFHTALQADGLHTGALEVVG